MQFVIQTVYHSMETLSKPPHFHNCHQIIFIVKGTVDFCNIINVSSYMAEITDVFNSILLEHNSGSKLADEKEQLLIKQLLIIVYRCASINFDNTYDDIVAGMKRQFENEYYKPFSLAVLAKQQNVSVSSLSHRFQAATGISVMGYLQSCRMANAKRMLVETDYNIGEIVEKCGFSDNSNFSRAFKKLNGLSPSDFRRKYKAE